MTEREVKHGKGWVIAEDTGLSDEASKMLSERSTHIYRDAQGDIINTIRCVIDEKGAVA